MMGKVLFIHRLPSFSEVSSDVFPPKLYMQSTKLNALLALIILQIWPFEQKS